MLELAKISSEDAVDEEATKNVGMLASTQKAGLNLKFPASQKLSPMGAKVSIGRGPANDIADIVHRVETLGKSEALSRLQSLDESREQGKFELGGILSRIRKNPPWLDGVAFYEWVAENTDIKGAAARALIRNYETVVKCGMTAEQFKGIGWTKVRHIASVLTKENCAHWVEIARTKSRKEIEALVKAEKAKVAGVEGDDAKPAKVKKFLLHDGQPPVVEAAIEKMKQFSGTDAEAVALERICLEYLSGYTPVQSLATLGPEALADRLAEIVDSLTADDAQKVYEALGSKIAHKLAPGK